MQYLYVKIRNLSPQIVFKKDNQELVREKPSPCLSRAKSKNLPWLHYQRLQIATKSMHRTSATPKSIQYLYQKIRNLSLQIVFKKYNHELVREKPSPCLTGAKSKNLPWLRYPHNKKENHNCHMLISVLKESKYTVHRICQFIPKLHGAELLSYNCKVCVNHPRFTRSKRALSPKHYLDTLRIRTLDGQA